MDNTTLTIGSRDSELALKQTNIVVQRIKKEFPNINTKIVTFKTKGDKILDVALSKIGGKSLFTKELEVALLANEVDIVVHSLKDLPTTLPEGLVVGAVCEREDPRDVVVLNPKYKDKRLVSLPADSIIGTSSVRRTSQLKRKYPHLKFESIRGNLNTRFRKLDQSSHYSAIILAAAGVIRMGWANRISEFLEEECLYAVGQGALAIEVREDDLESQRLIDPLNHRETLFRVTAERALMKILEGGCSAPLAVKSKINDKDELNLTGGVWSLDGREELLESASLSIGPDQDESTEGSDDSPKSKTARVSTTYSGILPPHNHREKVAKSYAVGAALAKALLEKGAKRILVEAKRESDSADTANSVSNPPNSVSNPPNSVSNGDAKSELDAENRAVEP